MIDGPAGPGLFLRACRSDPGLEMLCTALGRALAATAGASFASLFVDLRQGAASDAIPGLLGDLRMTGRLADEAEVTVHATLATLRAAPALVDPALTGRLAIRDATPAPAGLDFLAGRVPLGVEIGLAGHPVKPGLVQAWQDRGVVHLGLGPLAGDAVEPARRLLAEAAALGFRRYEAANWAIAGHEARWLLDARTGGPVLALGPGAYGRWPASDGWSWWRAPRPAAWRHALAQGADGRGRRHRLAPIDRAQERLIDGLHLAHGVDLAAIAADAGQPIAAWLDLAALDRALATGALVLDAATDLLRAADLDRLDPLLTSLLR